VLSAPVVAVDDGLYSPPPSPPPPFEATCFLVSGACAQFGEEDTCNSHYRMVDTGSRKCLWNDDEDSCKATGDQYDTIPPCASGNFPPPEPAPPPAFSCYTNVADAGFEYCYELPQGTACDGYFQYNDNLEVFLVCGFHETKDGKCIGGGGMGEDAVRSATPPEPLCSATPSPPPATDAILYDCQNNVDTQGVDWCWELPDYAPCGSFYQYNPTRDKYVQCVDVPNKEGQCRGGTERLDSPPECSPPTPPDPPAPPTPPTPGCYVDIAVYGLEWCYELRTGGETTYRPCDVHYKFNANKGIYKGCAAHPTKANQCTGGDVEWTSVPECSPPAAPEGPSAPPSPTAPGTSWCYRPTSALGADWCYELELGEGECELYYQTSGHGHRKCEYDAVKGRCIRSAAEVTVNVPEPSCSAPYCEALAEDDSCWHNGIGEGATEASCENMYRQRADGYKSCLWLGASTSAASISVASLSTMDAAALAEIEASSSCRSSGTKVRTLTCPGTGESMECCDADGSCYDDDDDWCCDGLFYCSSNGAAYAAGMGGVECPDPIGPVCSTWHLSS